MKQKNFHELYDKSKLAHLFLNSGASATMRLFLLDNSLFVIRFLRNFRCLSSIKPPIPTTYLAPKQGLTGTQGCRANPKHGAFQYSRMGDWLFGFFRSFGFCEFLDKFFQITIRIASLFMSSLLLSGSLDIFQNRILNITAYGINAEDSTFTDAPPSSVSAGISSLSGWV